MMKHAHRLFARWTKKEALVSFIARRQRQIKILKAQLLDAEIDLNLATRKYNEEYPNEQDE
jgi:hypothetical protein